MTQRTRLLVHLQLLSGAGSTLGRVPGLAQLLGYAAVTDLVEVWDDDVVHLQGTASFDTAAEVELGGFAVGLGPPGSTELLVPFAVTLPAAPVSKLLAGLSVAAGLVEIGEVVDEFEGTDVQAEIDAAADALGEVAVRVGPVTARLDFPEEWLQRGELITDGDGTVVDVEAADDAPPVSVSLGQLAFLVRSSAPWVELDLDGPASGDVPLELPPAIIAETGVALELRDVIWHRGGDLPQQAVDLGLADDWRGLLIGEAHVWGLDRLLPGLPGGDSIDGAAEGDPDDADAGDAVTALGFHDWVIDRDGVRGHVEIGFPPSDEIVRPRRFGLEFDRSWWPVALRAEAGFDLGGLLGETEDVVDVVADLRLDPHADSGDRAELALTLRGSDDQALARLEGDALTAFGAACGTLALLAGGGGGDVSDAGLLLGALAALDVAGDATGLAEWEQLAVEGASATVRRELVAVADGGDTRARVLRVDVDVRLAASLLPTGDEPIPIELGASRVSAALVLDDVGDLHQPRLTVDWAISDGLRVTLPSPVDVGGPVTITSASLRKTDDPAALVIELGVDPAGASDVAIGGLPDVVVITYLHADGAVDISLGRSGQQITLLVPGALYAEGSLQRSDDHEDPLGGDVAWGEVLRGELRAFLVADGDASGLDLLKKDNYLFDLEIGLLSATSADGSLQAFVVTLDAGFRPGLPIGTSGASIYGLGLTFAQNGAPGAVDGDYASWFFGDEPQFQPAYSTVGSKWVPQAGHWGFGASVTVGSQPDSGRSWNVGAGLFVLLPGPVIMVTGEGDLFAELPELPAEGGDPSEIDAAFAAVIVLDLLRDRFSLDLRGELERSAGGKQLLYARLPAAVRLDLRNPADFFVAIGQPERDGDPVQISALDLIDLSAYLVLSGKSFDLPLRDGDLELPGVALAFGGSGGLDKRFSAGPVSIELWALAGFDVGLSLSVPLLAGQVWIDGGLAATAFGFGISMEANLTLLAIAPRPFYMQGTVRIVIDLPWFLPDIDFDAGLEIGGEAGWLADAPASPTPVESLSLWDRGAGSPAVLSADGGEATGVPLDVVPELVFRVPVGNDTEDVAGVDMVGADAVDPVWELATTGENDDGRKEHLGYRHVLTRCVLRTAADGEKVADVCATWPEGTENGNTPSALAMMANGSVGQAAGGQVARTKLRLLDPLAGTVEARVGIGAELTERRWAGWDPCDIPADDRKDILRTYTFQSLSHLLGRGGWRPPILDVDIRPIDFDFADDDEDDEDDGRPTIRPGLPDIDIDPRPNIPDIRPVPDVDVEPDPDPEPPSPRPRPGLRPGLRPGVRPGVRPGLLPETRPGVLGARRTAESADTTDAAATTRPSVIARPVRSRAQLAGGMQGLRDALVREQRDVTEREEGDVQPSLRPLAPTLAADVGLSETLLVRPSAYSTELLSEPITLTASLPLLWASAAAAVEIAPGVAHYLPNVTPPDDVDARLVVEATPSVAGLWARTLGVVSEPARLGRNPVGAAAGDVTAVHGVAIAHDDAVLGLPRLVMPAAKGLDLSPDGRAAIAAMAAGALGRARIDLPYSQRAEAVLLLAPGVEPLVWAIGPDGNEELLSVGSGQDVDIDGGDGGGPRWRSISISTNDPVVGLRLAAFHGPLEPEPDSGRLPVAATLLAVGAHAPWRDRSGSARRSRDAYTDVIAGLLDQRDAWGDGEPAGVLEPDTQYELVVEGRSYPAKELPEVHPGDLELGGSGQKWDHTFAFRTASAPPSTLRAHPADAVAHDDPDPASAGGEAASPLAGKGDIDASWQVATSPNDGAPAHYLDDDLVVRLRDARTLAVFAAFGRDLRVRLVDDEGNDIEEELQARLRAASDVPAHEDVVRDRLGALGCLLPDGADPDLLWQEAVHTLEAELEPGRRYVAELHAADGDTFDAALHRWRFRTSRWKGLRDHLLAHVPRSEEEDDPVVPLDEIVPDGQDVQSALTEKLQNSDDGLVGNGLAEDDGDDEMLDAWLVDTLRVAPRRAPAEPEVVLIWAWEQSGGTAAPVALLLDGPEPLLRDPRPVLEVDGGDVDVRVITGRARARVLVVPSSGVLPTGTLTVKVTSRGASASRSVVVGDLPAVLTEGDA